MKRESQKSSEISFDEEFNSSNPNLFKEETIIKEIKEETPKTSSYTEKFRKKLQSFITGKEKEINSNTATSIAPGQSAFKKRDNCENLQKISSKDSCSIDE